MFDTKLIEYGDRIRAGQTSLKKLTTEISITTIDNEPIWLSLMFRLKSANRELEFALRHLEAFDRTIAR